MSHTMKSAYRQPPQGIDWGKVWQAYCVFMPNPAQGILHILAAAEYSRWQKWVLRRLRRQAAPILDREVVIPRYTRWSLCSTHDSAGIYG
jgi:hypothetical protein